MAGHLKNGLTAGGAGVLTAGPGPVRIGALSVQPHETAGLFAVYLLVQAIEYGGLGVFLPLLKSTRIATLCAWGLAVAVMIRFGPGPVREHRQGRFLFYLAIWSGFSVFWAIVQSHVPDTFRYMMDYLGLYLVTATLIDRVDRVRTLSIVGTLVILFTVFQNVGALLSSAGADRLVRFRAAYFMVDGNDMGWALVTLLCFPVFLALGPNGILVRLLGISGIGTAVVAIILTQSRGASLALAAVLLYYSLALSRRRVAATVVLLSTAATLWLLAPPQYRGRMETIAEYEEDSSAQGRIRAWKAAFGMALDYPLGVGAANFSSAYGRYYRPDDLVGYGANRWISAHSVYFKVLGEYGFLGLLLLVLVIIRNFTDVQASLNVLRHQPGRAGLTEHWPMALGVGLTGYTVAAIFLGGVTYPHLFLISGLIVSCRRQLSITPPAAALTPVTAQPGALAAWGGLPVNRAWLARARADHGREVRR